MSRLTFILYREPFVKMSKRIQSQWSVGWLSQSSNLYFSRRVHVAEDDIENKRVRRPFIIINIDLKTGQKEGHTVIYYMNRPTEPKYRFEIEIWNVLRSI